jgi:hypothetical protein
VRLPLFQIDAFTSELFRGNPAAVRLLDSWLDDAVWQGIAQENNLPEKMPTKIHEGPLSTSRMERNASLSLQETILGVCARRGANVQGAAGGAGAAPNISAKERTLAADESRRVFFFRFFVFCGASTSPKTSDALRSAASATCAWR